MFEWFSSPEAWVALATLMALEIVLGIDNIIFISILVARLPVSQRHKARQIGLSLAMATRLLLLFSLAWVMGLVEPLFTVFEHEISGRDMILVLGGLFLLVKSTHEIHHSFEKVEPSKTQLATSGFFTVLAQIAVLDLIFSLDSVITAVGLVEHLSIMVIAIVASVSVMLFAAKAIGEFVEANPTIKMLALSFLILLGFTLIAEGFDVHIPKGYIYFAMTFSFVVEMMNIKLRANRTEPVETIQLAKKMDDTHA
ncbi:TerC family protein [Catenovulum sp. SM1970]|uniref:TerC family protein n=1 Tax=Marinifaba aquimaris TaxID=2741323 RepID=UPI0015728376|nr:TerC family protein [Marinifaba aquimaris]NTS76808.1 TerC family protein [Marinifaba aquimaris]